MRRGEREMEREGERSEREVKKREMGERGR